VRSDSPHAASHSRVRLPRVADLPSTTLDSLGYKHDRQTAACLWSVATARGFPRRFISSGGFLVEVQELISGGSRSVADSPVRICIPSSVPLLHKTFYCVRTLAAVTFEFDSRLPKIEDFALEYCFALSSLCIPSSVQHLCRGCFSTCPSLSIVTFETGLSLLSVGNAFKNVSLCSPSPSNLPRIFCRLN
jgi:hypothetical protein